MGKKLPIDLLMLLRAAGGGQVSQVSIARRTGMNRAKVPEAVDRLVEAGFPVRAHPGKRWSLGIGGPLLPEEIRAELGTTLIGKRVIVLGETPSTQDVAKREAAGGARSGTVIVAEGQTRGRGRFQRTWTSSPGEDLTFSLVLRSPHHEFNPSLLTVGSAVAVCEAVVEGLNLPARIKWPNDVLLAEGKFAGILVERAQPRDRPPAFVLGIGINVNSQPTVEDATSLAIVSGRPVDRVLLLKDVLRALDYWFEEARLGSVELLGDHWRRYSSTLGTRVTVVRNRKSYAGYVLDICPVRGLSLQLDDGKTMTFRGEQVTLRE